MKFTYDDIQKFMKDYLKAYNAYAQSPETTQKMHDYYAPDFEIVHYVAGASTITGRDKFLHLMSSHPSSHEMLTPEDIVVDERRNVVVMLLKTELMDKTTGKIAVKKNYLVHYTLIVDKNNTLKIHRIKFFEEVSAPGEINIPDVFMKDPEMAELFKG
jgi:hypothetical protein